MTYPEQGPTELPPTVPNAVPGQPPAPGQSPPPASPVYPPGVAAVPPAVDPYAPRYGDTGYQAAPPYGDPGYGPPGYGGAAGYPPPGYPGAPYAQPPKRRTGMIIGIVAAVLVLCLGGGAVAAVLVLRNLDPTAGPTAGPTLPTSDPTSGPTAGPTTGNPPDFSGDLRSLLVPRPSGTDPWQDFASKDGNLDLNTAADLFQDPDAMRKDLTDMNFERGAVNHWSTDDDVDVLIILFQFESSGDAEDFVDSTEQDGIEDHDERGAFGDVPGSLSYVANKDDSNGKRSAIFLSNRGNIVSQVVVWEPDNVDVDGATDLALAQHGRLPN